MENSSAFQTSQDSPIVWPDNAFALWPSLLAALGLVAVLVFFSLIAVLISRQFTPTGTPGHLGVLQTLIATGVGEAAVIGYLCFALPRISGLSLRELGFQTPNARALGIAVLGAVVMTIVVNGLGSLISTLAKSNHQQDAVALFRSLSGPIKYAVFVPFAVMLAPLAEEFTFRVLVFNWVRRHSSFWPAAIVSGLLFGAAHADPYFFVPLAIGGIILCAVYALTRNAWMSMVSHGLFNAFSLLALIFVQSVKH
ncbi:MAG: CPBP family intramembrane metalloprotease [Candidatus Eremiobacteraeota bacterium]|nr:CPBP family intramembrane metalloprotease [Candidatus Eremiobacteraeota bacterium]